MAIIYIRPDINYANTPKKNATQFQTEYGNVPIPPKIFDANFDFLVDSLDAISIQLDGIVAGIIPGTDILTNQNKVLTCDGMGATPWNFITNPNLAPNCIIGSNIRPQVIDGSFHIITGSIISDAINSMDGSKIINGTLLGGAFNPLTNISVANIAASNITLAANMNVGGNIVVAGEIDSISATIGSLVAGLIQSTNYSGTWNGTPIAVTYGGTGLATLTTAYGVLCAGTTPTGNVQNTGAGVVGQLLTSNGPNALPTFQAIDLPVGSIAQVKQGTLTTKQTTNSNVDYVDTGLAVNIAPQYNTNKVLVRAVLYGSSPPLGGNSYGAIYFNLVRGNTNIFVGTGGQYGASAVAFNNSPNSGEIQCVVIEYLDSPNSTANLTYKIQWSVSGGTATLNADAQGDGTGAGGYRTASSITVMEVVA
jgi:hypothetical protein